MNRQNQNPAKATTATTNRTADRAVEFVTRGAKLIKVRSKFSKNERHFSVEPEEMVLSYKGSRKGICSNRKKNKQFLLMNIKEIRSGSQSDAFSIAYGKKHRYPHDSQCFSLVIGDEGSMLDLIAPDAEQRDLWVAGIRECRSQLESRLTNPEEAVQIWTKKLFSEADTNKNGALSPKEIKHLLNHMNIDVTSEYIEKISEKPMLNSDDLLRFLVDVLQKPELVEDIFKRYDRNQMYWTKSELKQFLTKEQKENFTLEECEKIIDEIETCPELKRNHRLGLTGFAALFESERMKLKDPKTRKVYQDMNQPLSHYFISSSHNTYLESDQLKGYSKTECYVKALKNGCRCVEMDVWDGDTEPVIYHGFTLTSKLLFSDVIRVIDKYAFCKTKYPLIVSIENHCSVDQQRTMAKIMMSTFKDKLFLDALVPNSNFLPPPSQLKERIVIKCKKLPEFVMQESKITVSSIGNGLRSCPGSQTPTSIAFSADDSDNEPDDIEEEYDIAMEFSDLINICRNGRFKSFEDSKVKQDFTFILSLSEAKALKLAKRSAADFIQHNKRQLSRIYPAGSRVGSTNYDPVPFWIVGCQVVALNYQTPGEPMQLNRGLFGDNGGCGYVLKPDFMRSFTSTTSFSPDSIFPNNWHRTLNIRILSGFCLPKKEGDRSNSILDPYVQISVVGVPRDRKTARTKTITNNGFHPVWNEEFKFFISCPELALLYLQVCDYEARRSDVVIAQYCLPVRCIQEGYRAVQLRGLGGEKLRPSRLFVRVEIT